MISFFQLFNFITINAYSSYYTNAIIAYDKMTGFLTFILFILEGKSQPNYFWKFVIGNNLSHFLKILSLLSDLFYFHVVHLSQHSLLNQLHNSLSSGEYSLLNYFCR